MSAHYFYFIPVYIFHSLLTFICTCTFPFILTHSLGVLTLWICIFRSMDIYCWSGIWSRSQASWGAGVLLLDNLFSVFFISSLFHRFHDSTHWTHACSILLFFCYHACSFICYSVTFTYHGDYIACSGYFRLSVYTWGIFLALYTSSTLVATPFPHILGSGAWHKQCAFISFLGYRWNLPAKLKHTIHWVGF